MSSDIVGTIALVALLIAVGIIGRLTKEPSAEDQKDKQAKK